MRGLLRFGFIFSDGGGLVFLFFGWSRYIMGGVSEFWVYCFFEGVVGNVEGFGFRS